MKKLLLLLILIINFSVLPSHAADGTVLTDQLSNSKTEDLDIQIPNDVPSGFHTVTIEVYDKNGTVSEKTISFCKDELGVVQWNNKCPNLKEFAAPKPADSAPKPADSASTHESAKATGGELVPYDPMSNPESTKDLQIAGFAALALLTSIKRGEKRGQESMQSVSSGALKLLTNEPGKGDLSNTWDSRFTDKTDLAFVSIAHRFNRFSPLLTRTVQDGNAIRAILGSLAALLVPIGLLLGLVAVFNTGGRPLPPSWIIIGAIMAVAIFDAFAGLVAGAIFFIATFLTGNITSRPELLTTIGVMVLFFAPALLANKFRPFRRSVRSQDDKWERITDYALAPLLTFWVITKMVAAMNGLARLELPITNHGTQLALLAAILILVRIPLEATAIKHYPMRLRALHVDIKSPSQNQMIGSLVFKILIFFVMAAPFVGSFFNLLLGTVLFAIPQVTSLSLEDKLPKKKLRLPKGVFKTIVMIFVMALVSNMIKGFFNSPAAFLKWSFVVMALPGFFLHYLDALAVAPDASWKSTDNGRMVYRIGGVLVFILMVLVVNGVNIASWLVG